MQSEQALGAGTVPRKPRRIQPSHGLVPIDFGEVWRYRDLLYYFLWRDVKARYKQTYLGAFWAVFRPFVTMVMFSAIFGGLAGIQSGTDIPYPLFLYAGLLAWIYFQSAVTSGASSLLNQSGLMAKAYFPRLYAPISSVSVPVIDFGLAMVILLGLFAWFQRAPSWQVVFLPLFLLLALLIALGVGLWLSGATVRYRDVGFALPFLVQLWMFATPVIYPASLVPERFQWLLSLNPMTAVVEGFRWSLLGMSPPGLVDLAVSVAFTAVVLGLGLFFFRRTERTIVDMI